jgi:predicted MFS family arabinose efflux permease
MIGGGASLLDRKEEKQGSFFLVLFCTIALVNYVDRGALNAVLTNLKKGLCLSTAESGVVVSAFTVGYIVAAPLFAHLSGTEMFAGKSFKLMGFGLLCFSVGSLCSFLSAIAGMFYPLLLARVLVGVGEAAFLVLAPPFIDRIAPDDSKGLWLALFYATIPFGMAIGFGLGGFIGQNLDDHYYYLFLIDGVLMAPFLVIAFGAPATWDQAGAAPATMMDHSEPFWVAPMKLLRQPTYVCLAMGYACYTFTIGGFSVFAPQFLQYTYDMQQDRANLIFGGITALTGLVGTASGGYLLERIKSGEAATPVEATALSTVMMVVSLPLCFCAFLVDSKWAFFAFLFVAELAIFAKEGPINSAMLWSVGEDLKPHAMAFSMLIAHLFGDIPSPPILGFLLDNTADYAGTYMCKPGMKPDPVSSKRKKRGCTALRTQFTHYLRFRT